MEYADKGMEGRGGGGKSTEEEVNLGGGGEREG